MGETGLTQEEVALRSFAKILAAQPGSPAGRVSAHAGLPLKDRVGFTKPCASVDVDVDLDLDLDLDANVDAVVVAVVFLDEPTA